MNCEEFVGRPTGTGQRARCTRPARYLAVLIGGKDDGDGVLVCGSHVGAFRRSPRWTVRAVTR